MKGMTATEKRVEKTRKVAEKKKEIQKERKLVKEMEEEEVVQGQ